MNTKFYLILFIIFAYFPSIAQLDITYQQPPKEILELIDVKDAPDIRINDAGTKILLLFKDNFKSIEELLEPEMRLAGLRINPQTNIGSRTRYYNNLKLMNIGDSAVIEITGLPTTKKITNLLWSPDQTKLSFTNTTTKGVELWLIDIENASAKKLCEATINANLRNPVVWAKDSKSMLVKLIPPDRKQLIDKTNSLPIGPKVSVSDGQKAQNRTYQDLLKDKADEFNFEQLVLSEIHRISVEGKSNLWKKAAMFSSISFSPDGSYIIVNTIQKPFSYLVPYKRFPSTTTIYTYHGKEVKKLEETPLIEVLPSGFDAVQTGKRNIRWRADKPATLFWAEALDGGDPKTEIEFRDEIFSLDAPFDGEAKSILKTINRFRGIYWGNDVYAIAFDRFWETRNIKSYLFNPSDITKEATVLFDRNYQDRYNDQGNPVTTKNKFAQDILLLDQNSIFLRGNGYSKEGIRPFIDKLNLKNKKTKRLWQADGISTLERSIKLLDYKKEILITRIESKNGFPNYFLRNIKSKKPPQQITYFENPFKKLQNVHKELIKYKREDDIDLSGMLYLPPGYDLDKKEKLPMLMWAYPREFKNKNNAGQVTSSPHEFTCPSYRSPVYWVMRGYAVLDRAAFPIIGANDEQPNDSFVPQLVANARVAIKAVDSLGYIDTERVAIGGHSYGAFMTANLLTHCDLFAAGIARSGAYNRTLTPFGFQAEERSYWEAPDVYNSMSPFMHADQMKHPLLLIHGEADNNSGTYPLQSERYFNALKGHGANARLVMLPKESHGYAARESVLHVIWEQDQWLDKWVKNKEK